uniref:polynucleotide adenylyltransferase n=1 Tax=Globodera rostochiensis TaxID=31243 RepID=A0A914HHA3_GLORO
MAADITVWMCRFEQLVQQQQLEAVRHELETMWLFFRSSYDIFWDVQQPFAEYETEQKLACAINNFILKIEEFVASHKNVPSDEKKTLADWHKLKDSTFDDLKLDEIDENNKIGDENCVEPVELVQKLHFEEFRKFSLSKIEENATKWAQIVDVLSTKNESKRNILQFLKFGDVKILFKMLGIVLNTENFVDCANIECANSTNLVESLEDKPNLNCDSEEDEKIIEKDENIEKICLSSIKLRNDLPQIEMLEENEKEISKEKDPKIVEKNKNEKRKNSLAKEWTRIGPLNLKAFCEDAFLYGKYAEFVSAPSDGLLVLLDIGAYANEIGQRIQMVEELHKIDNKLVPNLCHVEIKPIKDEWTQLLEAEYDNVDAVPALEWKLHQILWKILNFHQNSEAVVENADNEMRNVKAQIHLRKFAMALLADQTKFGNLWTKIEQKKRQKLLQNISGMRCGHIRFDHLKLRWQKMDAQIQIDQLLFNKLPESEQKSNKNLCPIFPKLSQQLNFVENIKNETKMSENLDNYLEEIVYKNAAEFDEKIKKSLPKIKAIFDEWSEGHDVQLLITGSFLLGTHTIHSDVDLLCIVPGKVIKKVQFFGTDPTQCQQQERVCSDGTNSSLYCQLCQNELVTGLLKSTNGPVLMIKFMFDQIPYDVTFVTIPDRKTLPPKMDDQTLEDLIAKFKKPSEINTKMLRVLSSYRSTLFIDNLILDGQNNGNWQQILRTDASLAQQKKDKTFNKNAKNFRTLILMLKLWAKNNYIYSTKYGYLSGTILTIMVTKIVLLYPNASVPFLSEKFFLIYSTRPLFLPIQLNELNESTGTVNPFFVRNPVEQEMPVYTPTFPEQNAASSITHCGATVIRKAMVSALTQIKSADAAKLFEWNQLFNKSIDFVEKYTYFVLINCVGEEQFGLDKFCQFVDGRIRRQIVYDLDPKYGPNIGTHLFPNIYRHKNCAISNKFLIFPFRLNFCTVWLLGINSRVNKAQMAPLLAQFDGTIKRDYLKYNPTQNNESAGGGGKSKRHKEFKMPQIEDIEATFGQSKLALKSILVNKWEMIDTLESDEEKLFKILK